MEILGWSGAREDPNPSRYKFFPRSQLVDTTQPKHPQRIT